MFNCRGIFYNIMPPQSSYLGWFESCQIFVTFTHSQSQQRQQEDSNSQLPPAFFKHIINATKKIFKMIFKGMITRMQWNHFRLAKYASLQCLSYSITLHSIDELKYYLWSAYFLWRCCITQFLFSKENKKEDLTK